MRPLYQALGVLAVSWVMIHPSSVEAGKIHGEPCESNLDCQTNVCTNKVCDGCPDRENNCPPPGVCSWQQHNDFQKEVDYNCQDFSCKSAKEDEDKVDCGDLERRVEQGKKCIAARVAQNNGCFKGGNPGHREQWINNANAYQYCGDILLYKKNKSLCK